MPLGGVPRAAAISVGCVVVPLGGGGVSTERPFWLGACVGGRSARGCLFLLTLERRGPLKLRPLTETRGQNTNGIGVSRCAEHAAHNRKRSARRHTCSRVSLRCGYRCLAAESIKTYVLLWRQCCCRYVRTKKGLSYSTVSTVLAVFPPCFHSGTYGIYAVRGLYLNPLFSPIGIQHTLVALLHLDPTTAGTSSVVFTDCCEIIAVSQVFRYLFLVGLIVRASISTG